ncbi:hypothetical protein Tcan_10666 [Toxocara canis]|uniref:Uncharacterized protein n=1 Tax=Toxocara canis TaxID=6265 RepID=A0A0B2VQA0_TOXCA|nr:hypothetical protein Tcan_10666 [Toxocara canis]
MDSETCAKLRSDIRADLREEIMAEVRQQLIPLVRALVQEMKNSLKSTVAATQFDQCTHYLEAIQQAEEKEIRERSVVLVGMNEVNNISPRERNNVDCGTVLDISDAINSDSVPHQIFRMGSQQEGRKRPVKVIFGNSHDAKQHYRKACLEYYRKTRLDRYHNACIEHHRPVCLEHHRKACLEHLPKSCLGNPPKSSLEHYRKACLEDCRKAGLEHYLKACLEHYR